MADPKLASFVIVDELSQGHRGAVEVDLTMADGEKRWCFFMTPEALQSCGDWVPGTTVRWHLGVPHMIVVSELTEGIVRSVLEDLDTRGQLIEHSSEIN